METRLIEIKVELDDSLMSLLKLKLESVKYADLSNMYMLIGNELKKRDASVPFNSNPTGNYPKN
jgi:hypothetical protein